MSIQQIISILEETKNVNGAVQDFEQRFPATDSNQSGGMRSLETHRLVRKGQHREASWDYPTRRTNGYRGDDGGPVRGETKRILRVDGPIESTTETVIGFDDRVPIMWTNEYPWRMITALEIRTRDGQTAHGTGFMVGPTTVLTAGHCLFDSQIGGWVETITVQPGLGRDSKGNRVRPFGSYEVSRDDCFQVDEAWLNDADPRYDYGLLELPDPVGYRTGWFSLGVDNDEDLHNRKVNVCGYSADLDHSQQWHSGGNVKSVDPLRLYHDCDSYRGNSGGPVWITREDDSHVVTAVHAYGTGAAAQANQPLNSGTRIVPAIADQVDPPSPPARVHGEGVT